MLTKSWVLFEGVGEVTESKLWAKGLSDWTDEQCFTRACVEFPKLGNQRLLRDRAVLALKTLDVTLFGQALPRTEHWRLWESFGHDALYLDIETTGLGPSAQITVLGTYFRGKFRAFVHGQDLNEAWDFMNQASLIVTFNGKQFDVPFIERHFEKSLNIPHIDLRFVTGSLGYKGGLKKIEPEFGIVRGADIKAVDGYMAVLLWRRHQRGDAQALKLLVDYNQADVEGLPVIMKGCWERKVDGI